MGKRPENSTEAILGESYHFRLCHFCLHLNESNTVVRKCGRCGRKVTNSEAAHALYRDIAHHIEHEESEEELQEVEVSPLEELYGGFDEEDDEEDDRDLDEMEATVSEALPISGLSVVW